MKNHNIKNMIGGWFIGNFRPSLFQTNDFEVAYKDYKANDYEPSHHHKIATEFTMIIEGKVLMNSKEHSSGEIIEIAPGESTDFKAITDVKTLVVKIPSVKNDKYLD